MKKVLLLAALLLVVAAPVAMAGGVNISWGTQCFTDGVGATYAADGVHATFACLSNTVPSGWKMAVSFALNAGISDFVSTEVLIKGISDEAVLPDWWELATGGCRAGIVGIVTASQDWSAALDAGTACSDVYGNAGLLIAGAVWPTQYGGGVNEIGLKGVIAATGDPINLAADLENYCMLWTVKNGLTVGTTCPGCLTGMTFGLYFVKAQGLSGTTQYLMDAIAGGNQCLVWNNGTYGCAAPVPARNTTWGQVKSLYR